MLYTRYMSDKKIIVLGKTKTQWVQFMIALTHLKGTTEAWSATANKIKSAG